MRPPLLSLVAVLVVGGLAVAQDKPAVVVTQEAKAAEKAAEAAPTAPPKTVKIIINTTPRRRARVFHGRKKLGVTPLKLDLPFDSGPRDIVVKAAGFITVNTRVYTFKDEKVIVTLTLEDDPSALFGYKEKLLRDAGMSDVADAGVGADPAVTPPATAPDPAPATPIPAAPAPSATP